MLRRMVEMLRMLRKFVCGEDIYVLDLCGRVYFDVKCGCQ